MIVDRVAYVVDGFPKVSETFVAGEVAAVRRRGIDARVLSLRPPDGGPVHDVVTREGLLRHTVYDKDRFDDEVADFRPQVIHAHFAREPTAVARRLAARHGVPFTFTVHGYDLWRKPPDDLGQRAAAAAAVVTVSHANATELTRRYGVDPRRVHVIPCGIDVTDFAPGPAREDPPLILTVARLRPVKRLELLLHALAPLHRSREPFRCRVIGDGPERSRLEALRDELGLRERVRFVGAASQEVVRDAWRDASIGVLTSTSEGMPIALMEAASSGVPVVATAVGGVPELVADGETGLLVAGDDVAEVTAALRRLLGDAPLRDRMGVVARARAIERFSVDRQVDRLTALWNEVATRTRNASIPVTDLFGVAADPVLVSLSRAVDPVTVQAILDRGIAELAPAGDARLDAVRVVRYKPQRRCLIEYDLTALHAGVPTAITVIGKVRRHRPGHHQHRLLRALWDAGFDDHAADAICVPQPMGELPELAMWLQRRVRGVPATDLLTGPEGAALAPRLADAAHKIHLAAVPTRKTHRIEEELRILGDCLGAVAGGRPELAAQIHRLLGDCHRAARTTPVLPATGIHRDFYADQVVVDGERLVVVDFDLYTMGDPALDIGNLLGHITEQALRDLGDPTALAAIESSIVDRFAEIAGEATRRPVRLYAALTVARHVFLAHERPERAHLVPALLDIAGAGVADHLSVDVRW